MFRGRPGKLVHGSWRCLGGNTRFLPKCLLFLATGLHDDVGMNASFEDPFAVVVMKNVAAFWQLVLGAKEVPLSELLAEPVKNAVRALSEFLVAHSSCASNQTAEDAPNDFADVSSAFRQYAMLRMPASMQDALGAWGLAAEAVTALVDSGTELCGGTRVRKLRDSLVTTLKPLWVDWRQAFYTALEVGGELPSEVSEMYSSLLHHIDLTGDVRLEMEARFMQCFGLFECAFKKLKKRWAPDGQLEPSADDRSLASEGMKEAYSELFLRLRDLKGMQDNGVEKLFPKAATSDFGIVVNEHMDAKAAVDAAVASGEHLAQSACREWCSQLKALTDSLAAWCPGWQAEAACDDFPNRDRVKSLLTNPHYKQLTPVANVVDSMLKAAHALVRGGVSPIFAPELVKAGTTARDLAYATTSLTVCVFRLYVELPKIQAAKTRAAEAAKLRKVEPSKIRRDMFSPAFLNW